MSPLKLSKAVSSSLRAPLVLSCGAVDLLGPCQLRASALLHLTGLFLGALGTLLDIGLLLAALNPDGPNLESL